MYAAHAFNDWMNTGCSMQPLRLRIALYGSASGVAAANPLIQHPEIPSLSLYSDIAFQRYDCMVFL